MYALLVGLLQVAPGSSILDWLLRVVILVTEIGACAYVAGGVLIAWGSLARLNAH